LHKIDQNMSSEKTIICYCKSVSRKTIEEAIKNGAKSLKDIQKQTGACTGNECKTKNPKGICCSGDILEILNQDNSQKGNCSCCH